MKNRTNARRMRMVSAAKPTKTKAKKGGYRLGFDWGGLGEEPREWRPAGSDGKPLGWWWPGSGGGALGWPGSGGGALGATAGRVGLGFHPDLPDMRDACIGADGDLPQAVRDVLERIRLQNAQRATSKSKPTKAELKPFVSYLADGVALPDGRHDLRDTGLFSPVEDQGDIGSCTAQAVVGMVEYLMRAGGGRGEDMSRMFLYKTTRRLLGWTGDTGAYIRTAIKSMRLFGVPPEHEWPYDGGLLDEEPDSYHYSFAQNFRAMAYARLDGYGANGDTLDSIKRTLLDGFPIAFGFPVYSSIQGVSYPDFEIPVPTYYDEHWGGHAVLAVGYDDDRQALIIRNSWGKGWGEFGYAYLPYWYVENEFATDFWAIFNSDWCRLSEFD